MQSTRIHTTQIENNTLKALLLPQTGLDILSIRQQKNNVDKFVSDTIFL